MGTRGDVIITHSDLKTEIYQINFDFFFSDLIKMLYKNQYQIEKIRENYLHDKVKIKDKETKLLDFLEGNSIEIFLNKDNEIYQVYFEDVAECYLNHSVTIMFKIDSYLIKQGITQ